MKQFRTPDGLWTLRRLAGSQTSWLGGAWTCGLCNLPVGGNLFVHSNEHLNRCPKELLDRFVTVIAMAGEEGAVKTVFGFEPGSEEAFAFWREHGVSR